MVKLLREETNQSVNIDLNSYNLGLVDDEYKPMTFDNNEQYIINIENDDWNVLEKMNDDNLHTIADDGIETIIPHK